MFCSLELDVLLNLLAIYTHLNLSIYTHILRTNKCINCGIKFAEYHCPKCNIWMALGKRPFHCEECGKFNICYLLFDWGVLNVPCFGYKLIIKPSTRIYYVYTRILSCGWRGEL